MAPETRSLLASVLALPDEERSLLVEGLLESLPSGLDEPDDEQWEAELDRRFDEFLGTVPRRSPGPRSVGRDRSSSWPPRPSSFIAWH